MNASSPPAEAPTPTIGQDDCATIDKDTALGACLTQASASLAPSSAGTSFCSSQQTADSQCGVTTNQTDCLNSVKIYTEATIAQATACTSKSCSLIYSCTSATLGQATGGWALGGGIKPGQRCSGTAETCSYFSYSQTSCQAASCTYTASCTGTPYCTYEYSSTSCGALTGCTWSTSSATCTGTSTVTCASFGSTACAQNVGCYLSSQCTGTTPACTTLTVSSCAAQPGCMVVEKSHTHSNHPQKQKHAETQMLGSGPDVEQPHIELGAAHSEAELHSLWQVHSPAGPTPPHAQR